MALECLTCGREIVFIEISDGKKLAVDTPGKVWVKEDGEVMTLYRPHWSSCSDPVSFRGSKQGRGETQIGGKKNG